MDAALKNLLLVMGLVMAAGVCAGELRDPTHPAIDLDTREGQGGGEDGAGERIVRTYRPSGLHSVFISPSFRAAMIDGKTIRQGESYAGAKLVEVYEDRVVLENAKGKRVMKLFPKVDMANIRRNETGSQTAENTDRQPMPDGEDSVGGEGEKK